MRMTCIEWTTLQHNMVREGIADDEIQPQFEEGNALWDKIEQRTFGKVWSSLVSIALTKREQELIDQVLAAVAERANSGEREFAPVDFA